MSGASPARDAPSRFLADAMLGRLARWLRVVGVDTLQLPSDAPDVALVARARDDERVLLTRDRHLIRELRPHRALACAGLALSRPRAFALLRRAGEEHP